MILVNFDVIKHVHSDLLTKLLLWQLVHHARIIIPLFHYHQLSLCQTVFDIDYIRHDDFGSSTSDIIECLVFAWLNGGVSQFRNQISLRNPNFPRSSLVDGKANNATSAINLA